MVEKGVIEKDTRIRNPTCKQKENEEKREDGSPLRPMFCLKKNMDMKYIEEEEDCFILYFNLCDSIDIANLSVTNDGDGVDLSVVAEKGQCYCYVCDLAVPCECWMAHCHASEVVEDWKSQRNLRVQTLRSRKL